MGLLPTEKTMAKSSLSDLSSLVHGKPKTGKSTLGSEFPNSVFLATEPGLNHLDVFQVPIRSWEDLLMACKELADGKHEFQTVIIDTIDNAYKFCVDFICKKNKVDHEADLPYGRGYAFISNEFHRVLLKLAQLPYGLVLISHSEDKEVETRTGKIVRTVPTLPNRAAKIVTGLVDLILMVDVEITMDATGEKSSRRVIRTKPHPLYDAGDRTGKLPEMLDLSYDALAACFDMKAETDPTEIDAGADMTKTKETKETKTDLFNAKGVKK